MQKELLKVKKDLEQRKKDFPFELLGRSLSFNPFVPKDIKSYLKQQNNQNTNQIIEISNQNFDDLIKIQNNQNINALYISTTKIDLEYLSNIRRYINLPIIRDDFIIDIYQILESLVYGADCVILIAKTLDLKELKSLYEYAIHLGLEVIIQIENKEDLLKAIKCGTNIIEIKHIDKNSLDLITLIPKGKIILGVFEKANLNLDLLKSKYFLVNKSVDIKA